MGRSPEPAGQADAATEPLRTAGRPRCPSRGSAGQFVSELVGPVWLWVAVLLCVAGRVSNHLLSSLQQLSASCLPQTKGAKIISENKSGVRTLESA